MSNRVGMKPNNPEDLKIWTRLFCASLAGSCAHEMVGLEDPNNLALVAREQADHAFKLFVETREGMQS